MCQLSSQVGWYKEVKERGQDSCYLSGCNCPPLRGRMVHFFYWLLHALHCSRRSYPLETSKGDPLHDFPCCMCLSQLDLIFFPSASTTRATSIWHFRAQGYLFKMLSTGELGLYLHYPYPSSAHHLHKEDNKAWPWQTFNWPMICKTWTSSLRFVYLSWRKKERCDRKRGKWLCIINASLSLQSPKWPLSQLPPTPAAHSKLLCVNWGEKGTTEMVVREFISPISHLAQHLDILPCLV